MSFAAAAWAIKQKPKSAHEKLVLVILAEALMPRIPDVIHHYPSSLTQHFVVRKRSGELSRLWKNKAILSPKNHTAGVLTTNLTS